MADCRRDVGAIVVEAFVEPVGFFVFGNGSVVVNVCDVIAVLVPYFARGYPFAVGIFKNGDAESGVNAGVIFFVADGHDFGFVVAVDVYYIVARSCGNSCFSCRVRPSISLMNNFYSVI